ncbi:MAG: YggS family pyridoxal phosphate-dependent enzyme [Acidimicrobiales bacterium]
MSSVDRLAPPSPEEIARRVERIRNQIADAGADPAAVVLVAVTKGFGAQHVLAAHRAGLVDLGESYVQEFADKRADAAVAAIEAEVRWHFIGRLQTNKVRSLGGVELVQSVDRMSLVSELAKRRPGQHVLVQVNIGDEPQKGGCSFGELDSLVEAANSGGLVVDGLMGVARIADAAGTRRQFDRLIAAADRHGLAIRSIGMSGDLEIAVAAGSTMVRVGTAIFGDRPPR